VSKISWYKKKQKNIKNKGTKR